MTTRWIYAFDEELPADADARSLVGGKGLSLREMTAAGLRVPPGFTLTTACCAEYYRLGRKWPEGLADELASQLARLEERTGRSFGKGAKPLLVSVRSGAARSMPGMMDTLLNCGLHPGLAADVGSTPRFWELYRQFVAAYAKTIHGLAPEPFEHADEGCSADRCLALYRERTGEDFPADPRASLDACVTAVLDSWENERAITYRERHRIVGLAGTAVNVQVMFPSQVSGIVFTRDPTAPEVERLVIESAYGLGESVVSGDVAPDRFLVDRNDLDAVETFIGHKGAMVGALGDDADHDPDASSLDRAQLRELCELCLEVEKHFGHPVDVEFGFADGELALLQARAVRGLDVALAIEPERRKEIERLRGLAGPTGRKVWVAHNLGETLPAPTPLTWDIVRDFMRGDGGFGRMYQMIGYWPSTEVKEHGFLELICGRIYADPDRLAELYWAHFPWTYDLAKLVDQPELMDGPPNRLDPGKANGTFLLWLLPTVLGMLQAARLNRAMRKSARHRYEQVALPKWHAWLDAEKRRDLQGADDAALLGILDERIQRTLHDFAPESLLPSFFGGLAYADLSARLEGLMGEDEGKALANTLTQALEGDVTFELNERLYAVAQGEQAYEEVLARYEHRCVGEMELRNPRWYEDDGYLRKTIERYRQEGAADPRDLHRRNVARREEAEAGLLETLTKWSGSCFLEDIRQDLQKARELLFYRENGKFELMKGYALIRDAIEALARCWDLGDGIYFLHRDELATFPGRSAELKAAIAERRIRHEALQRLEPARVVDSADLDRLGLAPELGDATSFDGTAVAAGRATGPARIVSDPGSAGDLGTGYVLVCQSTDPGWTPLFMNACALVVERGGVLSHGAIVARDFGIPAVVLPDATRLIPDGATVLVDGDQARVVLVDEDREGAS